MKRTGSNTKTRHSHEKRTKTRRMEERMNIDAEITKDVVQSIPRRLKAVVDAKGYPTKY